MFQRPKVIDPKTPTPKMSEENQNIQVFVRSRPLKPTEKKSNLELIPEKSSIKFSQQNKFYSFDNVFDTKAKQIDVYRSVVEPLVEQVVEGYNCTVFAYGQTGTGKTYTMVGDRSDKEVSWEDDPTSGVIPRAIDQLIDLLQCQDTEYTIRVSFLELYNEDAYDLLSPIIDQNKLRIYNDSERKGSVIISGLVELIVKTKAEIFEILEKGSFKRQTAPTLMNACSSRSHSIFSITVHIKEITLEGEEVVKMGKLNLVDLAGSENIGRSGAVEERFREAQNINKSLLTLGRVITSLVERSPHIPYRDSKLTRLLQDSLGGKTKTSIIATISPCIDDLEDTLSTLDYAQRAKKITNKPEVNLKMSKKTLISEYLIEIDKLRRDLDAARDKNLGKGIYVDAKNYACMEATLKEQEQNLELKEARIDQLQTDVNKWTNLLSEANSNLSEKSEELNDLSNQLKYLIADLDSTRQLLNQTKMEVEQQRVLVESHQITEQKLSGQAKSIMDVADECVSNNELLHGKVDKFSTLESDNINIRNQFLENYPEQIGKISQMNAVIFDTINDGYTSIEKSIFDNKSALDDKGLDLKSSFKQIVSTVESFSDRLLDLCQKEMIVAEETKNVKLMLTNFKSDLFSTMDASYKDFIGNKQKSMIAYELLVADSLKKRSQLEEMVMNEISKLNETSKHVTSTIKSIKEDLVQNLKTQCTENQRLKEEITRLIQINTKNEMALKQMFEISEILNKNSLEIKESLTNCEERIDVSSCNEKSFTNGLSIKSDELVSFVQKEKTQVETFLSNVDQHGQNNCQNIIDKCTEFKNLQIQMEADYQSHNNTAISLIENTVTLVNNQIDTKVSDVLVQFLEVKTDCVNELKSKASDLTNSTNILTESLIQMASQNDDATLDTYKDMQSYCEAYKSSQEHLINDCLKSCHEYFENGFKLYEPTGFTPKKTSYSYPKELACTSPHERIIARFKENLLLKESNNNSTSNGFISDQKSIENENVVDENEQIKDENVTFVVNKLTIPEKNKNKRKLKERN